MLIGYEIYERKILFFWNMWSKTSYNNDIFSVISLVRFEKDSVYAADLTLPWEVKKLFLIDLRFKKKHNKTIRKKKQQMWRMVKNKL